MNRNMISSSMSPAHRLGIRPLCHCCSGGEKRHGYKHTKAVSHYHSLKAKKSKPKSKDHRNRNVWK